MSGLRCEIFHAMSIKEWSAATSSLFWGSMSSYDATFSHTSTTYTYTAVRVRVYCISMLIHRCGVVGNGMQRHNQEVIHVPEALVGGDVCEELFQTRRLNHVPQISCADKQRCTKCRGNTGRELSDLLCLANFNSMGWVLEHRRRSHSPYTDQRRTRRNGPYLTN